MVNSEEISEKHGIWETKILNLESQNFDVKYQKSLCLFKAVYGWYGETDIGIVWERLLKISLFKNVMTGSVRLWEKVSTYYGGL